MKERKKDAQLIIMLACYFIINIPFQIMGETICSKQNGNWNDQATWDKKIPTAKDDVIISGHVVLIDTDLVCSSIRMIANTTANTKLEVVGGNIRVRDHFIVEVDNQNKHTDVEIKGSASVNIEGYVLFDRSIDNNQIARMQLHISDYGQMNVLKNFDFIYGSAHKEESEQEIWLEHDAQLNIHGSLTFEQTKNGREARILITDKAYLTVDRNMFIAHYIGDRVKIQLHNQSNIIVKGSLAFYHGHSNTDANSYIDLFDHSSLSVSGNFEFNPRGNKTIIYIRLHQHSAFHVIGSLLVDETSWDNFKIQLFDYSSLSIGGLGHKEKATDNTQYFNVTGGRWNISIVEQELVAVPKYKTSSMMD